MYFTLLCFYDVGFESVERNFLDPPKEVEKSERKLTARERIRMRLRERSPLITLDKLELNLERLGFTDRAFPDATPIKVSNFRLSNRKRLEFLGDDPENLPALELELSGKIDPVVDSLSLAVSLKAAPRG